MSKKQVSVASKKKRYQHSKRNREDEEEEGAEIGQGGRYAGCLSLATELPVEVAGLAFEWLPALQDLLNVRMTCAKWNSAVGETLLTQYPDLLKLPKSNLSNIKHRGGQRQGEKWYATTELPHIATGGVPGAPVHPTLDKSYPVTIVQDKAFEWLKAKLGRGILEETSRKTEVLSMNPVVSWDGLEGALDCARLQLCPWFPAGSLTADLHNVLQYTEGSFFKLHRDAPEGPTHLMTLSVDCNGDGSPRKGGELRVMGNKMDEKWEFKYSPKYNGEWAAWFNTTYHEVTEVKKGTMLAATFNVGVKSENLDDFELVEGSQAKKDFDALVIKNREDLAKVSKGACAFILDREYVDERARQKGSAKSSPLTIPAWKLQYRDRFMYEAFKKAVEGSATPFGAAEVVLTTVNIEYHHGPYNGDRLHTNVRGYDCDDEGLELLQGDKDDFPYQKIFTDLSEGPKTEHGERGGYSNYYRRVAILIRPRKQEKDIAGRESCESAESCLWGSDCTTEE